MSRIGRRYKVRVLHGNEVQCFIKRVLRAEQIGNFNPLFCIFRGKRYLVQSGKGDLSDPFRREKHYLDDLFIQTEEKI